MTPASTCIIAGDQTISRSSIFVHVIDVNDNPPSFEKVQYQAEVRENAEAGQYLLKVGVK